MSPHIRACIDGDGLLLSLVNVLLLPDIVNQPGTVPAPEGDPLPGYAWQCTADAEWQQIPDLRGRTYGDAAGVERMRITHLLQQPPEGWVLISD